VVVNEVWLLHKGLTPQVTQLLQVMMGAATGGVLGQGMSMRYSQFSGMGMDMGGLGGAGMGGELPYVPPGPKPARAAPAP